MEWVGIRRDPRRRIRVDEVAPGQRRDRPRQKECRESRPNSSGGQITVPEGVRRLRDLADPAAIDDENDRALIIAFAIEIPFIPTGDVRKLWAPYALEMKDEELARAELRWQNGFLEACKRIAKA
jgi:hypothetical protein